MGAAVDDRLRGGLLAWLALAALAVGGWWWHQAAPATGPVAAPLGSGPPSLAPEPSPLDRVLVEPDGRVSRGPGTEPDVPVVIHQESGAAALLVSHAVWEDRSHLTPGDAPLVRQSAPSNGERHLLMVTCTGPGTLTVVVSGSREDTPQERVACSGSPTTRSVTAAGGPLLVRFSVTDGEVDLQARLLALV